MNIRSFPAKICLFFLFTYIIAPSRLTLLNQPLNKIVLIFLFITWVLVKKAKIKIVFKKYILFYLAIIFLVNIIHLNLVNLIWSIFEIIFLLSIFPEFIKTEITFLKIIDIFIFILGALSLLGIIETFTGINIFDIISGSYVEHLGANSLRFGLTRSRGFLTTSINNAVFLGIGATLTAYRMTLNKNKKVIFTIIYWLALANMLSTLSRGVILIFTCVQIVFWWKAGVIKKPVNIIIFIVIAAFILVILQLFGVPVFETINQIYAMFAVVFNSDYTDTIADNFGMNIGGIGNRFDLYNWIFKAVKDNLIFGMGYDSHFAVKLSKTVIKTSIENTFLAQFYYNGIVGLAGFTVFMLGNLQKSFKKRNNFMPSETKISFEWLVALITVGYILSMLNVNAVDDMRLYYLVLMLMFSRKNFITDTKKL